MLPTKKNDSGFDQNTTVTSGVNRDLCWLLNTKNLVLADHILEK